MKVIVGKLSDNRSKNKHNVSNVSDSYDVHNILTIMPHNEASVPI